MKSDHDSTVELIAAQRKDFPSLLLLVEEFYRHFGYPFDSRQKVGLLKMLMKEKQKGQVLLIQQNECVIGYVLLAFSFSLEFNGPIAFIDELYILPSNRQKGVGSVVLAQIEAICSQAGMKAVRLESEAHNERATALYTRSGYHDHKRHLMTKLLNDDETNICNI